MKIKKMFKANNLQNRYVVQKCNGEYASFLVSPFREVKEEEMPYFRAVGDNAEEAEDYLYKFYGFEKEV